MDLQPGQNTALQSRRLNISLDCGTLPPGMELDVAAFLLAGTGKVRSDQDMVFYGQKQAEGGGVTVDAANKAWAMDLSRLPAGIERVALTVTLDQGLSRKQRFDQISNASLSIVGDADQHRFAVPTRGMAETALILCEVYQRNGQWKVRAVGQGFAGGLGPLARHFGVTIDEDPDATASSPADPPPRAPAPNVPPATPRAPAPAPAPSPAPSSVNLSKITLEKRTPISLEKKGGSFGEIMVNLRWERGSGGFKLFGSKGIDLDVGCMIELVDGHKDVVQALGNRFGSFDSVPYVHLVGDDRTGESPDGEFVRINGGKWPQFRRVLIFAYIYEGAPNWAAAKGRVLIRMPGQPELEAQMDSHDNRNAMCAIATLENRDGQMVATKLVEYYPSHQEMDRAHGFGFNWKAGRK